MMKDLKKFEEEVSAWPHLSVHPHVSQAGSSASEAQKSDTCILGGWLTFPSRAGFAMRSWRPDSRWITFRASNEEDLRHALWLMRLSFLRYPLKTAADPRKLLAQESQHLRLSPQFKSLLEQFLPQTAKHVWAGPITT